MLQVEGAPGAAEGIAATDYERLRAHLCRAMARVCPRTWSERRDDFVQDCLVRILDLARRGQGERRLTLSYLYKVAYSVLVDEMRRRRRRPETPLDPADPAGPPAPGGDPESAAAAREIGRGIVECLGCLRPDRRLGVTLYLQGHSVAEAARILEWTPKKTENLVYRGLADLRDCLAAKGMRP
jgi:RNA polymerase sigma-70 factor, ECF subfamily